MNTLGNSADRLSVAVLSQGVGPPWADGMVNAQLDLARVLTDTQFTWFGREDWSPPEPHFSSDGSARHGAWQMPDQLRFTLWLRRSRVDIDHLIFHPRPSVVRLLKMLRPKRPAVQTIQTMHPSAANLADVVVGDHLIAVTRRIEERLQEQVGNRPVTLIRPTVDTSRFAPRPPDPDLRSRFNLPPDGPLVIYAGNFTEALGALDAVKAFTELAKLHADAHFVLAMRDRRRLEAATTVKEQVGRLADGLPERVTMVGEVYGFHDLLGQASLVVFPATDVSGHKLDLPLVLLEAMALGIPIGVYDIRPLEELHPLNTGFAVGSGRLSDFIEAADALLTNPTSAQAAGQIGRDVVKRDFDAKHEAAKLRSVYESVRT